MSVTYNLKKSYFPSYAQIQQNIQDKRSKQHELKVLNLQNKIINLKKNFNHQQEHQKIKKHLLQNYHTTNKEFLKSMVSSFDQQKQILQELKNERSSNIRSSSSTCGNNTEKVYSLNYCIDQDIQQDNHYENHLKFKKQVLENQLFQSSYDRRTNKQKKDQKQIFKNLNSRPQMGSSFAKNQNLNSQGHLKNNFILSDKNKYFKQNVQLLNLKQQKKKLNINGKTSQKSYHYQNIKSRTNKKTSNIFAQKNQRKRLGHNQLQPQIKIFEKNTEKLKENYEKYLPEFQGANIIKWRLLGVDRQNQDDTLNIRDTIL